MRAAATQPTPRSKGFFGLLPSQKRETADSTPRFFAGVPPSRENETAQPTPRSKGGIFHQVVLRHVVGAATRSMVSDGVESSSNPIQQQRSRLRSTARKSPSTLPQQVVTLGSRSAASTAAPDDLERVALAQCLMDGDQEPLDRARARLSRAEVTFQSRLREHADSSSSRTSFAALGRERLSTIAGLESGRSSPRLSSVADSASLVRQALSTLQDAVAELDVEQTAADMFERLRLRRGRVSPELTDEEACMLLALFAPTVASASASMASAEPHQLVPVFSFVNHRLRHEQGFLVRCSKALTLILGGLLRLTPLAATAWRAAPADLRGEYPIGGTCSWRGLNLCVQSLEMLENCLGALRPDGGGEQASPTADRRTYFQITCTTCVDVSGLFAPESCRALPPSSAATATQPGDSQGPTASAAAASGETATWLLLTPGLDLRVTGHVELEVGGGVTIIQLQAVEAQPHMLSALARHAVEAPIAPPTVLSVERAVGARPVGAAWHDEWVPLCLEELQLRNPTARFSDEELHREERALQSGGARDFAHQLALNAHEIDWLCSHGWERHEAEPFFAITTFGAQALSVALRDRSSRYAASTHLVCDVLARQARGLTALAPPAYCNLSGLYGLGEIDPSWRRLLEPGVHPGLSFITTALVQATSSPRAFDADGGGYAVPIGESGGDVTFVVQDSPVVLLRSQAHDNNDVHAGTCRSLVASGPSTYNLPPFATCTLERVDEAGDWKAYGIVVQQRRLTLSVAYHVSEAALEETFFASAMEA